MIVRGLLTSVVTTLTIAVALHAEPAAQAEVGPWPETWYKATWRQATGRKGLTTVDSHGDVLILGGTTQGPSGRSGQAQWSLTVPAGKIHRLWLRIDTNGARFWYKGVHALQRGGTVDVFVNGVRVRRIVCTELQQYGDYWPAEAPPGSSMYLVGPIDVSAQQISGPSLVVVIVANASSAADVHAVSLAVEQ